MSYFIRFSALNLLLYALFPEFKIPQGNYDVLDIFDFLKYVPLGVPFIPGISIEFINQNPIPNLLRIFYTSSLALISFFPMNRLCLALGAIALILWNTLYHYTVDVATASIYLIPFLYLCFRRTDEENTKKGLVTVFGFMYFFSALNKLNDVYITGEPFSRGVLFRYSLQEMFNHPTFYAVICIAGILLQIIACLIIFGKTRKWALISLLIFHFSVSVLIIWSVPLTFFGASLLFLCIDNKKLKNFFPWLVGLRILFLLGTYAITSLEDPNRLYDIFSIVISVVVFCMSLVYLKDATFEGNYFNKKVAILPVSYFLVALLLGWPAPYGYTQFSEKTYAISIVEFPFDKLMESRDMFRFHSNWSLRVYKPPGRFLIASQTALQAEKILDYFCDKHPTSKYKYTLTKEHLNLKIAGEKVLRYSEQSDWLNCK